MEALVLLPVFIGIPTILAPIIIDGVSRESPTYRSDEQMLGAAGVFWDQPAPGGRHVMRHDRSAEVELERKAVPNVVHPRAASPEDAAGGAPAALGMAALTDQ